MDSRIESKLDFKERRKIRIHITRSTEYGDRFKLYSFPSLVGQSFNIPEYLGITLRKENDQYFVDQLNYNSLAKKAGIESEDQITLTEISNLRPLRREWGYAVGLLLLVMIVLSQWRRSNYKPPD